MEIGVGEACWAEVRVVEEFWVVFYEAGYEEMVVGVDCSAQAEGGIDPFFG